MKRWPRWLPLLSILLLAACSARQVQQPPTGLQEQSYQHRAVRLEAVQDWELTGRLAMDDGEDGGSGRLHWKKENTSSELEFSGALGRGAWRLAIEPEVAVLEKGDGSSASAPTVDQLVLNEIGWQVPVGSLEWWVRGLRAPGPFSGLVLDEEGLALRFEQGGWTVEFKRYEDASGIPMPRRVEAVKGDYRVKLAVSRWLLLAGETGSG